MNNLILLPGALGNAAQFKNLIKELKSLNNIKATALDLPGHGLKPYSNEAITVPLMAEALIYKLDTLGIKEPVTIFGHSLGGYIGLYMALKFPERINSLFTLGTKWHWTAEIADKETSFLNPEKMEQKIPVFVEQLKINHGLNWKNLLKTIAFLMQDIGLNQYLEPEYLMEINKPVRIGLGDRDEMVSFEETLKVYKALPQGQLQVFPNTHHPYEKADAKILVRDIENFLANTESKS